MKILLSAFACEPKKGSEFAVGWSWALALVKGGHDVVVLTRAQSRPAIEAALALMGDKPRFAYFDVPKALRWQRRGPLHAHAVLWQRWALNFARKLHSTENFDCVHHVTYAGMRAPSFMGMLGIPFIFGPVGGGERAPWRLRRGYSLSGIVLEAARDAANLMIRLSPLMRDTFERADRIYVTSPETLGVLAPRYRAKACVELAIATDDVEDAPGPLAAACTPDEGGFRVLYAGRFVDFKGMHLGLRAFALLTQKRPTARLTMVGGGPAGGHWRRLARKLRLDERIEWLPWQRSDAMGSIYASHHVLLFPSLHDSGGLVALEAMRHGLPVVCLKLGGPGTLVDDSCGRLIDPTAKSTTEVTGELGEALVDLSQDTIRRPLAEAARSRGRAFSWRQKVEKVYGASP